VSDGPARGFAIGAPLGLLLWMLILASCSQIWRMF
jgi:hypothetical protein